MEQKITPLSKPQLQCKVQCKVLKATKYWRQHVGEKERIVYFKPQCPEYNYKRCAGGNNHTMEQKNVKY